MYYRLITEVGTTNFLLLHLLIIIVVYPLFFTGYMSFDDARVAINYGFGSNNGFVLVVIQEPLTYFRI